MYGWDREDDIAAICFIAALVVFGFSMGILIGHFAF